MLRFFVLCFALLLPLQFAWAGAASYCAHESETESARAPHFGHHAHVHHGDDSQPAGGQFAPHTDCAGCHAAGSMLAGDSPATHAFPRAGLHGAPPPLLPTASAVARVPDRPQWPRLA